MKATDRLLKAAADAVPSPHPRAKYDEIMPVVEKLVNERQFNVQEAVKWLYANKTPGVTSRNINKIAGALRRRFQRAAKTNTKQQ